MRTAAHDIRASLVLAATVGALLAGPAHAAYAPQLHVVIDPSAHSTPSALTATITQAATDDSTRSAVLQAPPGFALAAGGSACSPAQEAAQSCPEASRLGYADAAAAAGAYTGGIFFGGGSKVVVLLTNGGLLAQPLVIEGAVDASSLAFPTLPDVQLTALRLRFGGAPRALVTTPAACGDYAFTSRFVSAAGATATSQSTMTVDGCTQVPPQISAVTVSPRVARAGATATVAFTLSEDAAVEVGMRRIGHGRLRQVGALDGKAGRNTLAVATRGVRPAAYALELQATDPDGLQRTKTTRLRVVGRR
jgi:hypothetical protein